MKRMASIVEPKKKKRIFSRPFESKHTIQIDAISTKSVSVGEEKYRSAMGAI